MFRTYGTLGITVNHCSIPRPRDAAGTFIYLYDSAPEGQNICRKRKYLKKTVRVIRFLKAKIFFRTGWHRPSIVRNFYICILRLFIIFNYRKPLNLKYYYHE